MELRDLLTVDIEALTAPQAQRVAGDIIATMAAGCVSGSDQQQLKAILVAAKQKALGRKIGAPEGADVRQQVLKRIKEGEARGDKRTARYLAESMGKQDIAALDQSGKELIAAAEKQMAAENAAVQEAGKEDKRQQIKAVTQELLYQHGWEWTEEQARQAAIRQVMGRPAYEDDIDELTAP